MPSFKKDCFQASRPEISGTLSDVTLIRQTTAGRSAANAGLMPSKFAAVTDERRMEPRRRGGRQGVDIDDHRKSGAGGLAVGGYYMDDLQVRPPCVSRTALFDHVARGLSAARGDPDLLTAYAERRDADAFRTLVERYAPLVAGMCRRILGDAHAAEDAVQTTFLALARRPGAVRGDALAGW